MPDNSITINGPIDGDIQGICNAIVAVMTLLATPQGQKLMETWGNDAEKFNTAIADAGKWIEGLFKRPTA